MVHQRRQPAPSAVDNATDDEDRSPLVKASKDSITENDSTQAISGTDGELRLMNILPALFVMLALSSIAHLAGVRDLSEDILTAAVRTFVQLSCLAAILTPFFKTRRASLVVAYVLCFMIPLSAYEATARSKLTYRGVYLNAACGLASGVVIMECVAIFGVIKPKPWYCARHVIPLAGMLINNALSGTALALERILDDLTAGAGHIEVMLAFGATPWEAVWPSFAATMKQALIPTLNSMNVIGLVAIPGMMTGQVLGGASPVRAARYQIVIMYLIAGATSLSAGVTCALTVYDAFDGRGVFRSDAIRTHSSPRVSQLFSDAHSSWVGPSVLADPTPEDEASAFLPPIELRPDDSQPPPNPSASDATLEANLRGTIADRRNFVATFSLRPGEIACLLGPSGIGKSTMLRAVAELSGAAVLDASESHVRLNGVDRSAYDASEWRRRVLYVPQGRASALPGSPGELLEGIGRLGHRTDALDSGAVEERLRQWGLSSSDGSSSTLDRPWSELSGGEAQRSLLAVALATSPDVLLLDEPTSALDDESKRLVEAALSRLDGTAVLMVTHDEEQAARVGTRRWRLVEVES